MHWKMKIQQLVQNIANFLRVEAAVLLVCLSVSPTVSVVIFLSIFLWALTISFFLRCISMSSILSFSFCFSVPNYLFAYLSLFISLLHYVFLIPFIFVHSLFFYSVPVCLSTYLSSFFLSFISSFFAAPWLSVSLSLYVSLSLALSVCLCLSLLLSSFLSLSICLSTY